MNTEALNYAFHKIFPITHATVDCDMKTWIKLKLDCK